MQLELCCRYTVCASDLPLQVVLDVGAQDGSAGGSASGGQGGSGGGLKRPFSATNGPAAAGSRSGGAVFTAGYDSDEEVDSSNWSQKDQDSLAQIESMLNSSNLDPEQAKSLKKQRRAMRNRASATASRQRKKEYLQNLERHMNELANSNTLLLTSVARMTEAETAREKHNLLVRSQATPLCRPYECHDNIDRRRHQTDHAVPFASHVCSC